MDTELKPTINAQNEQNNVDIERDERNILKFQVKTGVNAGGFIESFLSFWDGFSAGFNEADQSTQPGWFE
jgi:hypothetical protein